MYRYLNTKNGQLLFNIDQNTGFTQVVDGNSLKVVATIKSTKKPEIMAALRGIGTFLKKHAKLEAMGVDIETGALKLLKDFTVPQEAVIRAQVESEVPAPREVKERTKRASWA